MASPLPYDRYRQIQGQWMGLEEAKTLLLDLLTDKAEGQEEAS